MSLARKAARVVGLMALLAGGSLPADAAPDPDGALEALADSLLSPTGDAIGGVGLLGAGVLGLGAGALALVDANPITRPVLRGFASGLVDRLAGALSWSATGALEGLRAEDIETLPEPRALYTGATPGLGHLDSLLTGLGALELALEDLVLNPPLGVARAVGWTAGAERIAGRLEETRTYALGPLAAAPPPLAAEPAAH